MGVRTAVLVVVLLGLLLAPVTAGAEVESFRLANGARVKCNVVKVTVEGITVLRWLGSTGIEKREESFTWAQLHPEDRDRLRGKYHGYRLDPSHEAFFIRKGASIEVGGRTITGFSAEDESTEITLVLYTEGGRRSLIPRSMITDSKPLTVDIRDYLSPEDIYELYRAENPPISAADHLKLAEFCQMIGAKRPTVLHFRKACELDARADKSVNWSRVEQLELEYLNEYAGQLLKDAEKAFQMKRIKDASNLVARIVVSYPDTTAVAGALRLDEKIKDQLNQKLAQEVVADYYDLIDSLIRDRVASKIMDGPSKPGFKVFTSRGWAEGELCDINGKPVPPFAPDELDKAIEENPDEPNIYIMNRRFAVFEIPRTLIKKIVRIELNRKTKKPVFSIDQRPYVTGRDSELNRDIRKSLSFKYGLSDREIKQMWETRARPLYTIDRKVIRPSLARRINVLYGSGTCFSPVLKGKVRVNDKVGLVARYKTPGVTDDIYFEGLSYGEKRAVLLGIFAEQSLEVLEDSVRVLECPECRGRGRGDYRLPSDDLDNPGDFEACPSCRGLGYHLAFAAR